MNKNYDVKDFVIEKRHCENTRYADCNNCAGVKAFKEANPHINIRSMIWNNYYIDNFFATIKADTDFDAWAFEKLLNGKIKRFKVTFNNYRKVNNLEKAPELRKLAPLPVSHEFYKESKEVLDVVGEKVLNQ